MFLFELKKIDNKNKIHFENEKIDAYNLYMKTFILNTTPIERNDFNHYQ